ncbi:AraC family transcriptional regulator [Salipiger pallidus]|uniref:AraC family transcriptional regulator n=1 Tax=Salipiger pallidus TaxID=1775170 RepID=A0A8J2ZMF1_9RHOB|nr:helix-turn-helix domain-containing protein [Salipiger pallidus]GGG83080.1 AraC family transcriptional regulator [Salipiger pallidus]
MTSLPPTFDYKAFNWRQSARYDRAYRDILISRVDTFRFEGEAAPELAIQSAQLSATGASIHRVRSTGHDISVGRDSDVTAMFPLCGRQTVACRKGTFEAGTSRSLTLRPSERSTQVRADGARAFEAVMLKAPAGLFTRQSFRDILVKPQSADPMVETAPEAAPALRDLIRYILADLASDRPVLNAPMAGLSMETLLWEHFRAFLAPSRATAPAARATSKIRVAEAIDFMHANFENPVEMAMIAAAVGATPRSLQAAFQKVTGRSPWQTLTAIRLENARLRLLADDAGSSVTAVAMNCGFAHLGRFASLYRAKYGEPPSATLARRGPG